MTIAADIIEETGLDLNNVELIKDSLAPLFAERLEGVMGDGERVLKNAAAMMSAYKSLTSTTSPLAAVQIAYGAVSSAWAWFGGEVSKKSSDNFKRLAATRKAFIVGGSRGPGYFEFGNWSQVVTSKTAPTPAELKLDRGVGVDAAAHLSQYDPYFVWHVSRVGRPQTLYPTWSTPPYDESGVTPDLWGNGFAWANPTLLGGFSKLAGLIEVFWERPAALGPIPPEYREKYWSQSSILARGGAGTDCKAQLRGDCSLFGIPWSAIDSGWLVEGYAPPPGYTYLMSWGTYPFSAWGGAAGGSAVSPTFDACAEMAALAAAIHSLTPIHAAIPSAQVEEAYRHFHRVSGYRLIPPAPQGQVDVGVFLAGDALPYSPQAGFPVTNPATGSYVPWEQIRAIELSFRSFFKIRRAAIYQFSATSDKFKLAAAKSSDPVLRAVGLGDAPPPYQKWRSWDPLGEGWYPGEPPSAGKGPVDKKPPSSRPPSGPGGLAGQGGGIGLGAAALGLGAVALFLRSRR